MSEACPGGCIACFRSHCRVLYVVRNSTRSMNHTCVWQVTTAKFIHNACMCRQPSCERKLTARDPTGVVLLCPVSSDLLRPSTTVVCAACLQDAGWRGCPQVCASQRSVQLSRMSMGRGCCCCTGACDTCLPTFHYTHIYMGVPDCDTPFLHTYCHHLCKSQQPNTLVQCP